MAFMNIQAGDRIRFKQYAGLGRNGPEYREKVAPVNALLIFPAHVVVNVGGKYGTPQVVDENNFLGIARRAS